MKNVHDEHDNLRGMVDSGAETATCVAAEADAARAMSILEMAPDGIIIVDSSGSITYQNRQAGRMFGYKAGELVGKSVETLIPERLRDTHVRHRTKYASEPRTRPMGIGLDLYGLRRDGWEFAVEIALNPTWVNGELSVTAIIRDITERKRADFHPWLRILRMAEHS